MSGAVEDILRRAGNAEQYARWEAQARAARWCSRPVRLVGRTAAIDPSTGELVTLFASSGQPDGVVLKACGCRRESVCSSCAEVYRADAYQLVVAGLRGGKGVPETVAGHPAVFVTLTAPGFGPVHTQRGTGPCRRGRTGERCAHGRRLSCAVRHRDDDERLGEPLCPDCFDYEAAVLWNTSVSELWRRTTIYLRRALARTIGMPVRTMAALVRISYTKVVEYQRRGVVHVHAVVRLDGSHGPAEPPAPAFTVEALTAAVRAAVASVTVRLPLEHRGGRFIAQWGQQLDVRPITLPAGTAPARAVAGYLAKYATKSTDSLGQLDHQLDAEDLAALTVRPHLRRLVDTAWELGERPDCAGLRLREWAHTLGFRGHWLTKSRRYSTTFTALRQARVHWHATAAVDEPDARGEVLERKNWRFVGRGYTTPGDAWLAETAAQDKTRQRHVARIERRAHNQEGN